MQMHWAIFSSISCRILQTGEMGNSHLGAFQQRWLLSLNRDGWEGHLKHWMSVTGLSHDLPGCRDQTLDAQGSSASRVHFVPSGHCKTVGLQASSSLAFRSCFFGSCFSEIYSCQYWPPTFLVCLLLFFKGFFFLAMIASQWIHRNTPVVSQRWTCHLNVLPAGKSRSHSGCVINQTDHHSVASQ